jgi:uncharacterized protein YjiS (DUF1127 family)
MPARNLRCLFTQRPGKAMAPNRDTAPGGRVKLEEDMTYFSDNHTMERFVSPATQARYEKAQATAQGITGAILSIRRQVSIITQAVAGPLERHARARRTAKVLHGLSDRQHLDIGLHRVEIDAVAHDTVEAQVGRRHM